MRFGRFAIEDFLNNGEILLDGSVEDLVRAYDDQNAIEASKSAVKLSTENLPSTMVIQKGVVVRSKMLK